MNLILKFLVGLAICFPLGFSYREHSSVKAVALLFRHGDRSPIGKFPNDPNRNYSWHGGFGALTPKGVRQLFISGELKALRYNSLLELDANYRVNLFKLFVQSSSTKRCIDSAVHFLNGFLPSDWPHNLIKVLPKRSDEFLAPSGKPCPKHSDEFNSLLNPHDPEIVELLGENGELIDYVADRMGLTNAELNTFYYLGDTFKVQMDNGLEIPGWAEEIYETHLKPLGDFVFRKWSQSFLMHTRSGSLLKDMVVRLNAITKGGMRNILLYSAHDLTISSLMVHLGTIDQIDDLPDYGATLALELHESKRIRNGDYEIKMFYFRNYSDMDPILIHIPYCHTPCSFRRFKMLTKSKLTFSYDQECNDEK